MGDDRYDLLLLPDRFHCDEKPRQYSEAQHSGQQTAEDRDYGCPICLGTNMVDRRLPCGHTMCHTCLDQWATRTWIQGSGWIQSSGSEFSCPLCRASSSLRQTQVIDPNTASR